MRSLRPFRNPDPPALAALWDRALPRSGAVRPLDAHEFDNAVISKLGFDADGLIVAENASGVVGFVHAGFGPREPFGPCRELDHTMGTIAMLVVSPDIDDPDLGPALLEAAESYLKRRGAQVIYAGGQTPLNPFYWGVYGGSEFSGILAGHRAFVKSVEVAGYRPVGSTILYEADLGDSSAIRDPKGVILRRQTILEVEEDAALDGWWQAAALGELRPNRFRLLRRADNALLASATTWEMLGFPPDPTSASRIGLIDLEVPLEHRRKGYGRHLVAEILRKAQAEWVEVVSVQTSESNIPARRLYESLRFDPRDTSILYRKATN
ncbi:MAG: GNAT family N-acetyltransferase [Isosphaeraceae bacterium]|nr:GNAT family N-acetyltransferase [Isosphaeraceae bacterium]